MANKNNSFNLYSHYSLSIRLNRSNQISPESDEERSQKIFRILSVEFKRQYHPQYTLGMTSWYFRCFHLHNNPI